MLKFAIYIKKHAETMEYSNEEGRPQKSADDIRIPKMNCLHFRVNQKAESKKHVKLPQADCVNWSVVLVERIRN